jgi:hypothetical protein
MQKAGIRLLAQKNGSAATAKSHGLSVRIAHTQHFLVRCLSNDWSYFVPF